MSSLLNQFQNIRPIALVNCQNSLSQIEEIKDQFKLELENFFDGIESYLSTQCDEEVFSVLKTWSESQPGHNNRQGGEYNLIHIVNTIFQDMWTTFFNELDNATAAELMVLLFPLVSKANYQIVQYESGRSTDIIKAVLEETQANLEFIEKSKSKFIRIAAHELKTPLTIINGYVSMMNEIITEDQSQLKEMIKGIESGTARLKSIVQDLIDVSLIDNRLLNLTIQPVWLDRLFQTLELEIAPTIQKRDLSFEVHKFEGISQMFLSDPDRLMQVLRNIVSNAIKYTPDGGSIIISGRELPGFLEVIVTDTGIGIAPENQVLIFEKFIQFGETSTHSSSKTRYMGGGPGLGLHITRGILETMGGTIWVDSPGYDEIECPGSSFHILIPLNQQIIKNNMEQFLQQ
jgi:signal transduction histidine kinase